MKHLYRIVAVAAVIAAIWAVDASAAPGFEARIRISGGGTYDYCVIGMNGKATDGFDNAYDILSPGLGLNDTFISCTIPHPEWNAVKSDFRGDIRSLKPSDEWHLVVQTNLPAGTPLTMTVLPSGKRNARLVRIVVDDFATGRRADLGRSDYRFTATGDTMHFKLVAGSRKNTKRGH